MPGFANQRFEGNQGNVSENRLNMDQHGHLVVEVVHADDVQHVLHFKKEPLTTVEGCE